MRGQCLIMAKENISKQVDFSPVIETWKQKTVSLVNVAKTTHIPVGCMKHVEVHGVAILIANVGGKFYAVCDTCPHLNATLSEGTLNNKIVTCPRHLSSFDVTTGRVISGTRSNLTTYEVRVDGEDLVIEIE